MDYSETLKKLVKIKAIITNLYHKDSIIKRAGDVHPNPGPNTKAARTKTLNPTKLYYQEIKIGQSGDIHPNPGPFNIITKIMAKILILITILSTIHVIIENNETEKDVKPTTSIYVCSLSLSSVRFMKIRMTRKERKFNDTSHYICIILILLSGDVHLNPGPNVTHTCSICNLVENEENSLRCDTCKQRCHINCATGINDKEKRYDELKEVWNKSFEWICPNIMCNPNHHSGLETKSCQVSPNRYVLLAKEEEEITKSKPKKKNTLHNKNSKPKETDLWEELTKIKPADYIGQDTCRACHRNIKGNHQAISCDTCQRWIHRKCSDMNMRRYKENQKKESFEWTCNVCRQDEEIVDSLPDITKLKIEDLPEEIIKMKPTKEMLIIHMNCRSLINKFEELEHICRELNPDIVCCTETWMDDSVPENSHIPAGYKVKRKDRTDTFKQKYSKRNGGGIAVYYKDHIKVEVKNYMTDSVEEILWIHVKTKVSFMLGTIYRAAYTETMTTKGESKLEENIKKATEISNRLILNGDFNIDLSNKNNKQTQEITNLYTSYGLKQYVNKPTRINSESGRPTLIDHIWAMEELNMIKRSGTFTGMSDHFGTYMILNKQKEPNEKQTIKCRSYKKYDKDAFCKDLDENLTNSNIKVYIDNKDANKATEELIKTLQETSHIHAPLNEIKIGNKKDAVPWKNEDLNNKINEKNSLISDYFYYGANVFKSRIKKLSNEITHMKRKLKSVYIADKLAEAEGNSKKTWNLLNFITSKGASRDSIEPELINQTTADQHNKFFATVGTEIQKELNFKPQVEKINGMKGFKFNERSTEDIIKLIDRIKPDVAVGNDDIGAKLIKDSKQIIAPLLAQIINLGYETSTFPDLMKSATIRAIHKKNSTEDIENYRPISILPTLSKVFELDASIQMMERFVRDKALSKHQHAYQKGHNTVTCLFEVLNYLYKMADNLKFTAIVSLDLSKAFDSIDHTLLLNKLADMNMSESSLKWIKSYLTARKQRTKFSKITSNEETVKSGVPQGSILGPLLFLCFTNDLPRSFDLSQKILSYADDTQILVDADSIEELIKKIEIVITKAQSWYERNSMKNNIGKTEILLLNTGRQSNKDINIKIKQDKKVISIKPKSHIKILGVIIDSKLNWDHQVNNVKKKALNSTRNLHRINHVLPIKQRIQLYNTLTEPHFSYADIIWGGCGAVNSKKLQTVQNFAAKSITGNKKRDSATKSLSELKFLKLDQRRSVHETVFTHKSLLNMNPENINTLYQQQRSNANTRQATKGILIPPKHRSSKYQRGPLYRTINSWNRCTVTGFGELSVVEHKRRQQKQLITSAYTTQTH